MWGTGRGRGAGDVSLDASLGIPSGAREGAGGWLQVHPPEWTEAGERLVPRRTALAASNASNEREISSQIQAFFW